MSPIRNHLYEVIFEADTRAGKLFDVGLLVVILFSIACVMIESVASIEATYHNQLKIAEWIVTAIFSIEYIMRIWVVRRPKVYIFSFYGIIDLLALLPSYLTLFITGTHGLVVIRALRLLRVFRILKLNRYTKEGKILTKALRQSRIKIAVFLFTVVTLVTIIGTVMYLIEGAENGFSSIPQSIYWAIVTLTTVGYGDISPVTPLGQFLASVVMIIGYAIIAVPTGIVTSELTKQNISKESTQVCPECLSEGHDMEAIYCSKCGSKINDDNVAIG